MPQTENESYYKILGTTANISQRRIKEKYISSVKKHPPETDPEQFEKVREAYETLKDPSKRKQYDQIRKYGGKLEKMLQKAGRFVEQRQMEKAEEIYKEVLENNPDHLPALTGMMLTSTVLEGFDSGYQWFEKVLASPELKDSEEDEFPYIYSLFSMMLIREDYPDKAKDILEKGLEKYPDALPLLGQPLTIVYTILDKNEQALQIVESMIPSEDDETLDDIETFISWTIIISTTSSWSHLSKVQSRFRKFLNKLDQEEDKEEAFQILMAEHEEFYEQINYRMSEFYLNLAKIVTDDQTLLKERLKEVKHLTRVEKDVTRLFRDESIFPLMVYHTTHWFFNSSHPSVMHINQFFPKEMIDELTEQKDFYAAGILQLKKKYPALYKYFQRDWDDLYNDLTKDFNRETKRGLKSLTL